MPKVSDFTAESVAVTIRNFRINPIVTIDELTLDGSNLSFRTEADGIQPEFTSGETKFRGMLTEANINKLLDSGLPHDSPVKHLKVTLYTGRAQFKGSFVKSVMSIPFTLDAKPVLTNGIRLTLDCSATHIGAIGLPGPIVDIIERVLNERLSIDLTNSEVPVTLDEVRCEPGRLTVIGKVRFVWPSPKTISDIRASPSASEAIPAAT